jgi:environmental stress-induced protein Ves
MTEILRARDRRSTRWRNGAGFATDVVTGPRDASVADFDWRISIATIGSNSDFSVYPGVDRYLMPLSPSGLDLEIDGTTQHVDQFDVLAFDGESNVRSVNVTTTSLDLNLMLRRDVVTGSLTCEHVNGRQALDASVALMLDGTFDGLELYDAVLDPGTLAGTGHIAIARIHTR